MSEHEPHQQVNVTKQEANYLAVHLSHVGILPSHLYFGGCFFVLGFWWSICMLHRQNTKNIKNVQLSSFGRCQLIEGCIKAVACIVGMVVEGMTVSSLGRPANYTFTSIYASFLLAAIVDIASGFRVVFPEGLDFVAHSIAFANLGALARSHGTGHLHLTVATRLLTSYIALFTSVILLVEVGRPESSLTKNIRVASVMLQGVWLWQAGIVLDTSLSERWSETNHANLMYITIAFAWDMCGCVVFQTFLSVLMAKLCSGRNKMVRTNRFKDENSKSLNIAEPVDEYMPLQTSVTNESSSSS